MTTEAYIFDAIRTPRGRGKASGALHEVKPITLLSDLLVTLQERNQFDTAAVDDIVMGCVTAVGDQGAVIAKTAALTAGWDNDVAGVVLNRFCASGLEAVNTAAMKVRSGWEHLVVAGGVESMSRVPMGSDGGAWAMDPETNIGTGFMPQGIGADLIATLGGYSREDVDAFAMRSHQKAAAAWEKNAFSKSIIPVTDRNGLTLLDHDELIRPDSTVETLGKLKASFQMMGDMGFDGVAKEAYPQVESINHIHSPGNSSGIVDGAAAVLLSSPEYAKAQGWKPRARIVAMCNMGDSPTLMLNAPVPATRKVLAKAGLRVEDIDLFEINEAFAVVTEKYIRDLKLDRDKVNVNGGAMALGHPIGATGSMLVGTVVDELERRGLRYGLVTMCAAGGMAPAIIVERM